MNPILFALVAFQAPVALTKPDKTIDQPFSQLVSVRELKDGRVLVVDSKEKVVQIADFESGTVTTIGRNGSGPGEYRLPAGLVPMPGGRTLVYDPMNQRFLDLSADGRVQGLVTFSSLTGLKGVPMMILPAADAKGRLYFEPINPAAMGGKDSTAVLRWTEGKAGLDTAGFVGSMDLGVEMKDGKPRLRAMKMFAPQETWVIDPAGRLARIAPEPYRVIWYGSGPPIVGQTVAYQPVPVAEADKEMLRAAFKQGMAAVGSAAAAIKMPEPEFAAPNHRLRAGVPRWRPQMARFGSADPLVPKRRPSMTGLMDEDDSRAGSPWYRRLRSSVSGNKRSTWPGRTKTI